MRYLCFETLLTEALTISPADQIANELMTRVLATNAEISFEMTSTLTLEPDSEGILDDTEQLLEIRRANMNPEESKKAPIKIRSSPRISRKLRFSKDAPSEDDMDTT